MDGSQNLDDGRVWARRAEGGRKKGAGKDHGALGRTDGWESVNVGGVRGRRAREAARAEAAFGGRPSALW